MLSHLPSSQRCETQILSTANREMMLFVNDAIANPLREEPALHVDSTPNQKRAQHGSAPQPGSEDKLIKQAAEVGATKILRLINLR